MPMDGGRKVDSVVDDHFHTVSAPHPKNRAEDRRRIAVGSRRPSLVKFVVAGRDVELDYVSLLGDVYQLGNRQASRCTDEFAVAEPLISAGSPMRPLRHRPQMRDASASWPFRQPSQVSFQSTSTTGTAIIADRQDRIKGCSINRSEAPWPASRFVVSSGHIGTTSAYSQPAYCGRLRSASRAVPPSSSAARGAGVTHWVHLNGMTATSPRAVDDYSF